MFLFFDTETTGLPKHYNAPVSNVNNWPRLVQIAWILCDESGNNIRSRNYIVKPEGFTIPKDALLIHRITNERALEEGVPLPIVLKDFSTTVEESEFLVAHNISFDIKIVGAEFVRMNLTSSLFEKPRICTMKLSTDFCQIPGPHGYKWPSLEELYLKIFRSTFKEMHNATEDVKACAKCFFKLKELGIVK